MGKTELDARSRKLRRSVLDMFGVARRGHLPSAFSIMEILRVLYDDILVYDVADPKFPRRDRFILSKGHGCLALYAILRDKGFIGERETGCFCRSDGLLGGHPSHHIPGVEVSTGSVGHGLSVGVGMALSAKMDGLPQRVYVLMGDGETNEGAVWEAALSASKNGLTNLVALIDCNGLQSYGTTESVMPMAPMADKWESFGFEVHEVDGHSVSGLRRLLRRVAEKPVKPVVILCRTVKGKGIGFMENEPSWHHRRGVTDAEMMELYMGLEEKT